MSDSEDEDAPRIPRDLVILPAPETKDIAELSYTLWPASEVVTIYQDNARGLTTGSTLWLGAQVLAIYLEREYRNSKPLRCLELGAGTGLVSIKLASLGFDVIATDVELVVDSSLTRNLRYLDRPGWGKLSAATLDWTQPVPSSITGPFDFIVAADTIFANDMVEPLLTTMRDLATPSTTLLIALERRDPDLVNRFFDHAGTSFKCTRIGQSRLRRAMKGLNWRAEDWAGIELWRLRLRPE